MRFPADSGFPYSIADALCLALHNHISLVQPDCMVAELTHGCHRMGDKEKCRSIFQHMMHALLAFFLECRISDGQHLIDDQDLRLHDRGDSKSQTGCHTGGVVLDRHIHEVFEFCKFDDLIVVCIHEFFAVTENGAIQIDVFRRRQFAVESAPSSIKGAILPFTSTVPRYGFRMPQISFNRLIFRNHWFR